MAYEIACPWYPEAPADGTPAGLSILTDVPGGPFEPTPFVQGSRRALEDVLDAVKEFGAEASFRSSKNGKPLQPLRRKAIMS